MTATRTLLEAAVTAIGCVASGERAQRARVLANGLPSYYSAPISARGQRSGRRRSARRVPRIATGRDPASQKGTGIMASEQKIRVAIVGLGFGAEFIPIYQNHPYAEMA